MKRITERTLIEFDADDKKVLRLMAERASSINQDLWALNRLFTIADFDVTENEWRYRDVKTATMSRAKLLNDLARVKRVAEQLLLDADLMREKVKAT